jgi:DNA polymerase-3 subunit epsilon
MMKGTSRDQYLPSNLPAGEIDKLPKSPGVYYFHDQKGKVVYVGKAKNLRQRVSSHFSNNKPGRQKQDFLRHIYRISFEVTGTELMAFLLECIEIKRLWPAYNRSMKRFEQVYGLYMYEDRSGYQRLVLEKQRKQLRPVYTFCLLHEGQSLLRRLIREYGLCARLCYVQKGEGPCEGVVVGSCQGACEHKEPAAAYNKRVQEAVEFLTGSLPSFGVVDEGRHAEERSCILVERGRIYGMGYLPMEANGVLIAGAPAESWKLYLTPYPENDYMRGLVYQHVEQWPAKKIQIIT